MSDYAAEQIKAGLSCIAWAIVLLAISMPSASTIAKAIRERGKGKSDGSD